MLRGLVNGASRSADTIATLPEGMRPAEQRLFTVHAAGGTGRVDVLTTGAVMWQGGTGNSYIQLDGIQFQAELI